MGFTFLLMLRRARRGGWTRLRGGRTGLLRFRSWPLGRALRWLHLALALLLDLLLLLGLLLLLPLLGLLLFDDLLSLSVAHCTGLSLRTILAAGRILAGRRIA
jgi:hypothetical protein